MKTKAELMEMARKADAAGDEDSARRFYARAKAAPEKVDETEGTVGRWVAENVGPAVESYSGMQKNIAASIPAALHNMGVSTGSALGLVDDERASEVIQRNRPLMSTGGGLVGGIPTEIAALAVPVGKPAQLARGSQAVRALPGAVQALTKGGIGAAEAGTAAALVSDPIERMGMVGTAAAVDAGLRSLPIAGKALAEGSDFAAEQLAKVLASNPGIAMTEAAERLQELVPDIKIPIAKGAKNAIVRKAFQLMDYLPFSQGKKEADTANEAVQRQAFRDAGMGEGPFPIGDKGFQAAYRSFDDKVKSDYDRLINTREFDAEPLWMEMIDRLGASKGPGVAEVRAKVYSAMREAAGTSGRFKTISGDQIGSFKRQLRKVKDLDDTTDSQRELLQAIIDETDDNIFKILGEPDAARLAELNAKTPQRNVLTKAMAKKPYSEAIPATLDQTLRSDAPEKALARGEAKGQDLVETAADVLQKPATESSSPFAAAALVAASLLPAIATLGASNRVTKGLLRGEVPAFLLNTANGRKFEELLQKLSKEERKQLLADIGLGVATTKEYEEGE